MKSNLLVAVLVAGLMMTAGCVGGDDKKNTTSPTPTGGTGQNNTTKPPTRELLVTADDSNPNPGAQKLFSFAPATLSAKKNETVKFSLKGDAQNVPSGTHNLVVEQITAAKVTSVGPGATKSSGEIKIELNPGTYKYYCDLGSGPTAHRTLGMEGTLTITAA